MNGSPQLMPKVREVENLLTADRRGTRGEPQ
jgi:hypothetical protein